MKNINFGKKPADTKIQLTKGGDFFEIYIPPLRFDPVLFLMAPFTIFWNVPIWLTFVTIIIASPEKIQHVLLMSPFLAIGALLFYFCLFTLFCKTYLRIDRHEVSLVKTLFGQNISRKRPEPKREITKLIFVREYSYRDSDGYDATQCATFKIEIGKKLLELSGCKNGIKHEAELEWLAFEVSEWLDRSLTIIEAPLIG
jgi:hypothetical protein